MQTNNNTRSGWNTHFNYSGRILYKDNGKFYTQGRLECIIKVVGQSFVVYQTDGYQWRDAGTRFPKLKQALEHADRVLFDSVSVSEHADRVLKLSLVASER